MSRHILYNVFNFEAYALAFQLHGSWIITLLTFFQDWHSFCKNLNPL